MQLCGGRDGPSSHASREGRVLHQKRASGHRLHVIRRGVRLAQVEPDRTSYGEKVEMHRTLYGASHGNSNCAM